MSDAFIQYVRDNLSLLNAGSIEDSIQCISGALTIANNTYVTDQSAFINSYLSEVIISDLNIYDITSENRVMSLVESQLTFNSSRVINIDSSSNFISLSFQSIAKINSITYSNGTAKFIAALLSSLQIVNLDIHMVTLNDNIFSFVDCNSVIIEDISINQISSTRDSMILLSGSSIDSISNLIISDSNVTGLYIVKSYVSMMDEIAIYNTSQSIQIEQSHIEKFQNSQLIFSGSEKIVKGGAICLENSNMTIQNITFDTNTAQVGGAVSISCDVYES